MRITDQSRLDLILRRFGEGDLRSQVRPLWICLGWAVTTASQTQAAFAGGSLDLVAAMIEAHRPHINSPARLCVYVTQSLRAVVCCICQISNPIHCCMHTEPPE